MTSDAAPVSGIQPLERKIVWWLCVLAAVHGFIFSTAFPFFDNLDEPMHLDLVLKYSHGHVPHSLETASLESSIYLAFYSSYAYSTTPDEFPGGQMPMPLWTEPPDKMKQAAAAYSAAWQKETNYESSQAPLYYMMGGGWWNLGKVLGFHDGRLLYWLRFLNIALVAVIVWLGYGAARLVFPENSFLQLAVPALVAVMPQSAFYSIENDPLSAFTFGVGFICLLRWLESPTLFWSAGMFLALAATYLTKTTNLPLLLASVGAILVKLWLCRKNMNAKWAVQLLFLGGAAVPIVGWMIWCKIHFGDLTGSAIKIHYLGWTTKPVSQWLSHPIFTPSGAWAFFCGNVDTFWQGEFAWHKQQLRLHGSDIVYTLVSLALMVGALSGIVPQFSRMSPRQRYALGLSLACLVMVFGFFALMSVVYDFQDCPYPSRAYPYFASGRLMLGALIPFLLLMVYGLDRLLNRHGNVVKFTVLATMMAAMLIVEIATDWPVFTSPYNWYHLP